MAILLEKLNLQDFDDGLDGLLRQAGAAAQDLLLEEPYWLQVSYECISRGYTYEQDILNISLFPL